MAPGDSMTTDAIVVGAGAGGCVVAGRLAEAGLAVVLVDQGPGLPFPGSLTTVDALDALTASDRWSTWTALGRHGRTPYLQGRGVGGSAAVNSMVALSGGRPDYDRWARDPGWEHTGWSAMSGALATVIDRLDPVEAAPGPLGRALIEAAGGAGRSGRSCDPDWVGAGPAWLLARGSHRHSAAESHLDPTRPELSMVTGERVDRIVTERGRVVGVDTSAGTRRAPVVVAATGALETPGLLARSGLLAEHVRPVEDHPSFAFTVELRPHQRVPPAVPTPPVSTVLVWSSDGGPGDGAGVDGGPDAVAMVLDHVGSAADQRRYGAVVVQLGRARSRGGIDAGRRDGVFAPGWLQSADDRRRFGRAVRHVARLLDPHRSPPMAEVAVAVSIDDRGRPLAALVDGDDGSLDQWLATHPGPVRHVAATLAAARPGAPPVVDGRGRLVGVDGLWVADASAMPVLPVGNPQVPVMALARWVADCILAEVD